MRSLGIQLKTVCQVQEAWLETFEVTAPLMDKSVLTRDVLAFTMAKVSLEEPTPVRCLACKLMGIITPHLASEVVRVLLS